MKITRVFQVVVEVEGRHDELQADLAAMAFLSGAREPTDEVPTERELLGFKLNTKSVTKVTE